MQNRYMGDIGDYIKYGLLRSVTNGKRLGVAWYLFCPGKNESSNTDGDKIRYLDEPARWSVYDPELFDFIKQVVNRNKRKVSEVEASGILGHASFSRTILDHPTRTQGHYYQQRATWRYEWFQSVQAELKDCGVIFVDPDNGLCEDDKFRHGKVQDWKRLPIAEAKALSTDRTAIIYHHNARTKGAHKEEINYWMDQFDMDTLALYCRAEGNRTFFIINPTQDLCERLGEFAFKWPKVELISGCTA